MRGLNELIEKRLLKRKHRPGFIAARSFCRRSNTWAGNDGAGGQFCQQLLFSLFGAMPHFAAAVDPLLIGVAAQELSALATG
jgi:hypothetical protein